MKATRPDVPEDEKTNAWCERLKAVDKYLINRIDRI